ncbi:hypothetical protein ACYOEI_37300 [Singulisphaera rosea]
MALVTRPVRLALAAYGELLGAANRQDLDAIRRLCSSRYLASHALTPAREGGIVGFPRNIHKNFQAWREGPDVWICPTNRVGPVYRFVYQDGRWRFDGLLGLLRGRNELVPLTDLPESAPPPEIGPAPTGP